MNETLTAWAVAHGALGLLVIAWLAATLLPLSSELAVVGAVALGMPAGEVFVYATLGNSLGALTNYAAGWLFSAPVRKRLGADAWGQRALQWTDTWGHLTLAGSFLPVVGDPIMLAAGVFRLPWRWVVALGLGTRAARYAVILWVLA